MIQGFKAVAFRADASLDIGTGHVMRCLTLADGLAERGVHCLFLTRSRRGDFIKIITQRGHVAFPLSNLENNETIKSTDKVDWLGVDWQQDAEECYSALSKKVDWLIVDHYGIDARWENHLSERATKIMVIDDLADRPHVANVLVDQNLVANMQGRYNKLVPAGCTQLIGPTYALVRPEFEALRKPSLLRRETASLDHILIFMSGADIGNETCKVVMGLSRSRLASCAVDIVVGASFPFLKELRNLVKTMSRAQIHVQTSNMAELMASADLAITAGGSATWEKCVVGLPSIVEIMSENQKEAAMQMHYQGAQLTLGWSTKLTPHDFTHIINNINIEQMRNMSIVSRQICDGSGVSKVISCMELLS